VGLRDRIAHEHGNLDLDLVDQAALDDLKELEILSAALVAHCANTVTHRGRRCAALARRDDESWPEAMARRSNAASEDAAAAECHRICEVGHQATAFDL